MQEGTEMLKPQIALVCARIFWFLIGSLHSAGFVFGAKFLA